mmetsp:Transcript_26885/g.76059  ORF Transcript_26885/g.76059 Transcript_26885/m.76059 type:complete len:317 (+) Transcript_26885:61-1011(+)
MLRPDGSATARAAILWLAAVALAVAAPLAAGHAGGEVGPVFCGPPASGICEAPGGQHPEEHVSLLQTGRAVHILPVHPTGANFSARPELPAHALDEAAARSAVHTVEEPHANTLGPGGGNRSGDGEHDRTAGERPSSTVPDAVREHAQVARGAAAAPPPPAVLRAHAAADGNGTTAGERPSSTVPRAARDHAHGARGAAAAPAPGVLQAQAAVPEAARVLAAGAREAAPARAARTFSAGMSFPRNVTLSDIAKAVAAMAAESSAEAGEVALDATMGMFKAGRLPTPSGGTAAEEEVITPAALGAAIGVVVGAAVGV